MLRTIVLLAVAVATRGAHAGFNAVYQTCGIDYSRGDLATVRETNPDACPFHCAARERCEHVTWTSYEGGTCWLKTFAADPTPSAGGISYYLHRDDTTYAPDVSGFQYWKDYDMPGYDIGSTRGADVETCKGLCSLTNSCWGVVWTDYQGGTCWFKSRGSTLVKRPGAEIRMVARKLTTTYGRCAKV